MLKYPIGVVVDSDDKIVAIRFALFDTSVCSYGYFEELSCSLYNMFTDTPSLYYVDISASYMINNAPFQSTGFAARSTGIYFLNRDAMLPRIHIDGTVLDKGVFNVLLHDQKNNTMYSHMKSGVYSLPILIQGHFIAVDAVGNVRLINATAPTLKDELADTLHGSILDRGAFEWATPHPCNQPSRVASNAIFVKSDALSPISYAAFVQDQMLGRDVVFADATLKNFNGIRYNIDNLDNMLFVPQHINTLNVNCGNSRERVIVQHLIYHISYSMDDKPYLAEPIKSPLLSFPCTFSVNLIMPNIAYPLDIRAIMANIKLEAYLADKLSISGCDLDVVVDSSVYPTEWTDCVRLNPIDVHIRVEKELHLVWNQSREYVNITMEHPEPLALPARVVLGEPKLNATLSFADVANINLSLPINSEVSISLTSRNVHNISLITNSPNKLSIFASENTLREFTYNNPEGYLGIEVPAYPNGDDSRFTVTGITSSLSIVPKPYINLDCGGMTCIEVKFIYPAVAYGRNEGSLTEIILPHTSYVKFPTQSLLFYSHIVVPDEDTYIELDEHEIDEDALLFDTVFFFGSKKVFSQLYHAADFPLDYLEYAGTYEDYCNSSSD